MDKFSKWPGSWLYKVFYWWKWICLSCKPSTC